MISGQRMIILPTVAVRTSIRVWKLPIVAPRRGRKHLSQQTYLLILIQSNATTVASDYSII